MKFKFERDSFWWERLRMEELGIPETFARKYLNPILPDKFFHFVTCYGLMMLFSIWLSPWISLGITLFLMIFLWEVVWDGCYRNGFSYKDVIADLLGSGAALAHLLYPGMFIGLYIGIMIEQFILMWAFSSFKPDYTQNLIILFSISFCSFLFLNSTALIMFMQTIGIGVCYWWLLNPKIGQDYE